MALRVSHYLQECTVFYLLLLLQHKFIQDGQSFKSSPGGVLQEKLFLELSQNSQKNICARVSFLIIRLQASTYNFIKKETLAQVFSCEFDKMSKNIFFTEHLRWLLLMLRDRLQISLPMSSEFKRKSSQHSLY